MEEGQRLPCAGLLIFQGEQSLELLNIPRRAINLILVSFNCRIKWLVFLAIFIFPSQSLASGSLAHSLMTSFLPSFLSWALSLFGSYTAAEFGSPPNPGAFRQPWTLEV